MLAVYHVDEYFPHSGQVLIQNNIPYTCVLGQTDIESNANKFYNMQIIQNGAIYYHLIRYGRISEPGKTIIKDYPDANSAITSFEKQFKTKTKNEWKNRNNFIKKPGCY